MFIHTFVWGLGVGWLAGLAETTTASSLITTLFAVFAGAATLGASKQKIHIGAQALNLDSPQPAPVTAAVIGLCSGYAVGVAMKRSDTLAHLFH